MRKYSKDFKPVLGVFFLEADGKTRNTALPGSLPDDSGPSMVAFRDGAVHRSGPPGAQELLPSRYWVSIMLAPSPGIRVTVGDKAPSIANAAAAMLAIDPAGADSRIAWPARMETMIVSIAPESLRDFVGPERDRPDVSLSPVHLALDNTAQRFAKMVKAELNRCKGSNVLYLDSLLSVLAIHVLRNWSTAATQVEVKGALSAAAEKRIRDYLQENFRRKLSIAELAGICGLSPGYFTQAFAKTFGSPPHRYVLERRLEYAEKLLAKTEMPVAEVAYLSGFSSQSHLTSMLRLHKRKTPSQYR